MLSQFDFTDVISNKEKETNGTTLNTPVNVPKVQINNVEFTPLNPSATGANDKNLISSKHAKRCLINTHFDHKTKRKFPGPAGLLTRDITKTTDDNICHMELLSQVIVALYEFESLCKRYSSSQFNLV